MKGVFISFEGGEGSGKTTQTRAFARLLEEYGISVLLLREPGGTPIGEAIRRILLNPDNTELSPRAELMLYEAARAQLVDQVIKPALEQGKVVICDRFCDSTLAYQGFGRGLDMHVIEGCNRFVCDGVLAQRTIYLELPAHVGLIRATRSSSDRIENEGEDFHQRVHEGFSSLAAKQPQRFRILRTREDKVDTCLAILEQLGDLFPQIDPADARILIETRAEHIFSKEA